MIILRNYAYIFVDDLESKNKYFSDLDYGLIFSLFNGK